MCMKILWSLKPEFLLKILKMSPQTNRKSSWVHVGASDKIEPVIGSGSWCEPMAFGGGMNLSDVRPWCSTLFSNSRLIFRHMRSMKISSWSLDPMPGGNVPPSLPPTASHWLPASHQFRTLSLGKKISQLFYSKNNVSLVVLHHHPLHLQVQDTRVHHDRLPESHITIPEQRTFIIQQRL